MIPSACTRATRTEDPTLATEEVPCVRIGRRVLYDVEDLRRWIATRKAGGDRSINRRERQASKTAQELDKKGY
jgi:hypothetical protein